MITHTELEAYCLAKPGTEKGYPFDFDTPVVKVMGKMFALWGDGDDPVRVNLKCDPEWSLLLRDTYPAIEVGYHMSKKHWNTVVLDGTVSADLVWELVDHSYNLVVKGLKKSDREQLAAIQSND